MKCTAVIILGLSILSIQNTNAMAAADPHDLDKQLLQAVARNDIAGAHALLDAGADINYEGEALPLFGYKTPLSIAAAKNFEDMVTMLLEYESPNPFIARDGILKTLLIAEQLKTDGTLDPDYSFSPELTITALKGLFTKPLAINKKNHRGETALFESEISASSIQKLIDYGADFNAIDNDGDTPVIHAVNSNNLAALITLINNKADLNTKDHIGYTALHQASSQRKIDMVNALIKAGADQKITDPFGNTAKWHLDEADKWPFGSWFLKRR